MIKLSAVIITFNEEHNIERCLNSLKGIADEIIVVDSFSTDRTAGICKDAGVRFIEQKWLGYSAQKNLGNSLASYDYVLSIDADEALSEELKNSILAVKTSGFKGACSFNRMTNYCGKWIRHSGWYPDTKVRIFNKNTSVWQGALHETLTLDNTVIEHLSGDLLHYSYYTRDDHIRQIIKFTDIAALDYFKSGKKNSPVKLYGSPAAKFIRDYFINLGFLDGKAGFTICRLSAKATYLKYSKLKKLWRLEKS
ncbi:MAG: glycosyl transferase [Bacteroidetes bacterium GWF2_41_31]|nr:MAG: glycosyl transferase [Bacteroidetes bacterium GWF2_41_31]OFZ07622.1 MAG: glycosyl transferase [Bacteroidetes bacterium RIFOXYB12_FULL_41_6]